jgi:NAD(P)-dependent dehydrogenase (short-subunit alcohol dehydrogenase family)
MEIQGTIALVTGANRGIGRALVDALLSRGAAKVYATARRPETLADLIAASGGRVVSLRLDVTVPRDVRDAAEIASDVQILINNAGVLAQFGADLTDERWLAAGRTEFKVNVLGTIAMTEAFAPILVRNGGGAILNMSSAAALVALPALASYNASKAAVHSFTQATRAVLQTGGTFVAGVYPGPIDTAMSEAFPVEKTAPLVAANAILDGLEAGEEEIFPDPTGRRIGRQYLAGPKALEQAATAGGALASAGGRS